MPIISSNLKKCSKCSIEKALTEFHKYKRSKTGVRADCKTCRSTEDREFYIQNRDRVLARGRVYSTLNKEKRAARSRRWNIANPERRAAVGKAWYIQNKERRATTNKEWYIKNRDRNAVVSRAWELSHPEAVKAKSQRRRACKLNAADGSVTTVYLIYLLKIQDNRCGYCLDVLPEVGAHLDHIYPLSKGGTHAIGNVIYTCPACNLSKGAKLLEDWLDL